MSKTITAMLLGAALLTPLYLSTPAEAQSSRSIQRLEERVQEAKNRGDWNQAGELERQLNRERLQYQRRNGMGEAQDNGYFRFNLRNTDRGYYNPYYNRDHYQQNRGYYDAWGRWHSY
jgi:hypothetical protein